MNFRVFVSEGEPPKQPVMNWPLVTANHALGAAEKWLSIVDVGPQLKSPKEVVYVFCESTYVFVTVEVERIFTIGYRSKEVL